MFHQYDTVVYPRGFRSLTEKLKEAGEVGIGTIGKKIAGSYGETIGGKIGEKIAGKVVSTVGERVGGAIVGAIRGKEGVARDTARETHLKPLSLQQMGELCLEIYLTDCKGKLRSGNFPSIPSIAEEIDHIFQSLYHRVIIMHSPYEPTDSSLDQNFKKVCYFIAHFSKPAN